MKVSPELVAKTLLSALGIIGFAAMVLASKLDPMIGGGAVLAIILAVCTQGLTNANASAIVSELATHVQPTTLQTVPGIAEQLEPMLAKLGATILEGFAAHKTSLAVTTPDGTTAAASSSTPSTPATPPAESPKS